ncbi:MAG TPA: CHASE domain-containing protein [Noviherbaspirillum sp.]|nr:CHASE domain-containing protein [Noviherbaspirillum sp.]
MKQIESSTQRVGEIFKARDLITVITVLLSLYVTYNVWSAANQATDKAVQTTFDFRVRESNERIQQRLLVYEQVLRATVGLFRASTDVTRSDFRNYIEALDIGKNYPGIQGMGFSIVVPPAEKDKHERMVRAEGFPEYRIKPEGEREIYSSILYLEPFTDDNLRAFGYDMYSEPTRQEAMAMARDTAQPAMSGKVTLVQEGSNAHQSGFLVYLPVYRNGTPPELLAQRRADLVGWVYAPFRINHFMHGIQGESPHGTDDLDIEIYDDGEIAQANRMYDSDESAGAISMARRLHSVNRIVSGQHTWTVVTSALPAFEQKIRSDRPGLVLRAGISISLLLGLLIWIFLDDRARALQAANQAMQLALYDPLTGLPNRKLLDERLERELARSKRDHDHVALLFIDLDKFKPVNDTYGHAYGDLLLKEVAKRLHSCMREADTASRLGGDEFVALLTEIEGRNAVTTVATKILKRLSEPYEISGHTFNISASIGAALYPEDGTNPKALIKSADMAMYDAKNAGRSNLKFANAASVK